MSAQLLPAFVKIDRHYFRLVTDSIPENRIVVTLLSANGRELGPAFVYEVLSSSNEKTSFDRIRAGRDAAANVSEADRRQVQFCQHVMTVLDAYDSPYYHLAESFQVDIYGPELSGTGSLAWRSGKVSLSAVAKAIVPDLKLILL